MLLLVWFVPKKDMPEDNKEAELQEELNTDDMDEMDGNYMDVTEEHDDDDDVASCAVDDSSKRGYLVELFPFARPVQHYVRLLQELGKPETAYALIAFSRTAHPGLTVAAKALQVPAYVHVGAKAHSFKHGEELMRAMFTREVWGQATKHVEDTLQPMPVSSNSDNSTAFTNVTFQTATAQAMGRETQHGMG